MGPQLRVSSDRLEEQGIELGTPDCTSKGNSLSTTPQQLVIVRFKCLLRFILNRMFVNYTRSTFRTKDPLILEYLCSN